MMKKVEGRRSRKGAGGRRVKLGAGYIGVSSGKLRGNGKGNSRKGRRVDVGEGEQIGRGGNKGRKGRRIKGRM